MKSKKLIIWGSVTVVAVVVIIVVFISGSKTSVIFNTAVTHKQTVEIEVMATGDIQPVEEVEVGTQVSGVIEKIYVDYNSHVKAGQLLAELDRSTLNEKLSQANFALRKAESDLLYSQQNYDRVKQLSEANAATIVSLEEAVNRLAQSKASVEDAKANVKQATVNRDYTYIYSPIDGVILDRQVNVGQTVAASFNTPTLFTIAEDLTKMQVEVDVDEADIGLIRLGQKAVFTVDAYKDDSFTGTVQQIRLQPTVTSNVVTYTVIVEAPNPEEKLFPGMTANITIKVNSDSGITAPMEALKFKMAEQISTQLNPNNVRFASQTEKQGYAMVWVKSGEELTQRPIVTGINDGINTIIKSGLSSGEEVVLSASSGKVKDAKKPTNIMPGPPR